jgi:hypothetical protein
LTAVSLRLPPRPELLYVIRSVTISVASVANMPVDTADDLCIAVDEAATILLDAGGVGEALSLNLTVDGGEFTAVVAGDSTPAHWPPADFEKGLAYRVLSTLTDSHSLVLGAEGPQIRLGKEVPDLE